MTSLRKIYFTITFLISTAAFLSAQPTFMNSYPYQDLFPPTVWAYNSYCCNVIPAIGGGFLLEVHMEPCWDISSAPQAMFLKYQKVVISSGENVYGILLSMNTQRILTQSFLMAQIDTMVSE